jgi:hypothetical protein
MNRRTRDITARLRASDPVRAARIGEIAEEPWATELLARIIAIDPERGHDATLDQSIVPARRAHTRVRVRPILLTAVVMMIGGAVALTALNSTPPALFSGKLPTDQGGLPSGFRVLPSSLHHPIEVTTPRAIWGLWTGHTAGDRYLVAVTMRLPIAPGSSVSPDIVGPCPALAPGQLVGVCLVGYPHGEGFVAGRAVRPIARVELQAGGKTFPGTMGGGFFLIPASISRRELLTAQVVARAAGGQILSLRPAGPSAR